MTNLAFQSATAAAWPAHKTGLGTGQFKMVLCRPQGASNIEPVGSQLRRTREALDQVTMSKELSNTMSFWVSAGIVAHTLWTSAAPAMAYPLYAQEWNLTPTVTTAIFAVYPIVVVAILVGFGDVSDYIGRRKTMLVGLASSALGVLPFAAAPNVETLFVGRIFMGIGVGLSAGPSTAALVEYAGSGALGRANANHYIS